MLALNLFPPLILAAILNINCMAERMPPIRNTFLIPSDNSPIFISERILITPTNPNIPAATPSKLTDNLCPPLTRAATAKTACIAIKVPIIIFTLAKPLDIASGLNSCNTTITPIKVVNPSAMAPKFATITV